MTRRRPERNRKRARRQATPAELGQLPLFPGDPMRGVRAYHAGLELTAELIAELERTLPLPRAELEALRDQGLRWSWETRSFWGPPEFGA